MKSFIQIEDFIGKRFGRLTILSIEDHTSKVATKGHVSKNCQCKCDCGLICTKDFYLVKAGKVKSCGCKSRFKIKTSSKVNHLTEECLYCGRKGTYAKGLCQACYLRKIKHDGVLTPSMREIQERKRERERKEAELPSITEVVRDKYKNTVLATTNRQQLIHDMYFNENLSQSEIARRLNISRQAVGKSLKAMQNKKIKEDKKHEENKR